MTQEQQYETSTPSEQTAPAVAKKVAGKYVAIYRNAEGLVGYDDADDKKSFVALLNDVVARGDTVERVYKGAKSVQAKVTQKVSF